MGEGFEIAQMTEVSSAGEALTGMAARIAAGSDALAALVRQRQDLAGKWRALNSARVGAFTTQPMDQYPQANWALRDSVDQAGKQLDVLDARIATQFPQYAELSHPKPLDLKDAQALLAPGEVMLVYLVGDKEGWLWAFRRDRAEFLKLDIGGKPLAEVVMALRAKLDPALNADMLPFDTERANALYEKIVAPVAALLDGAREVFVVPDGPLDSLPFGVLVTKPPTHAPDDPADYRAVAWFAREHALTVLPSVELAACLAPIRRRQPCGPAVCRRRRSGLARQARAGRECEALDLIPRRGGRCR